MKLQAREAVWRERIGKWRKSGLSGPKFCARHGLYLKSFYSWRKRLEAVQDLVPVTLAEPTGTVRIEVAGVAIVVTEQSSPVALRTALQAFDVLR